MDYMDYEPITEYQELDEELEELAIRDAWIRASQMEGGG